MIYTLFAALLLLLSPLPAQAWWHGGSATTVAPTDPTVGVLPSYDDAYANWKNAGLAKVGGIAAIDAARTTVCATVNPTGIIPPASGDDVATIQAAVNACPAGDVLMLGAGTFQRDQSEYVLVDKSITIRGSGSPSGSCATYGGAPCWPTVANTYNGAIPDWTISGNPAGANCGVTAASVSTCSTPSSFFLLSPSGNYNWGWSGCNLGSDPTGCGTTLAADVAQGATTIQVANTANFSVGMWVLIAENPQVVSTTNPTSSSNANVYASPEWLNTSGTPAVMRLEGGDIPGSYSFVVGSGAGANQYLNQEIHLVTAVGAGPCPGTNCTLTFDDPLSLAFRQSGGHATQVFWPTIQGSNTPNPFLQEAGIENLSITKSSNGGVGFVFCAYCWESNVETGNWIAGAANTSYSVRDEIANSYFHDCTDCENNGNEYPVGISSASTEIKADNNIIIRGGKGMVGRGSNTAVIAYNYVDDTFYMTSSGIGDYWEELGANGTHYAGAHHWLLEGNWTTNCDGDETHGASSYHTFFRNDCVGQRTPFTDPSNGLVVNDAAGIGYTNTNAPQAPGPLRAAGPMAFNYLYGYVGNVLGPSNAASAGWTYKCTSIGSKCIWMSGWTAAEWNYDPDPNLNGTNSPSFIFRNGNYDYVNNAVEDWASGYSETLPSSFFLTSEPTYFSDNSCTWPWVSSTGSQQLYTLPAMARFDAGTPFTAVSCGSIPTASLTATPTTIAYGNSALLTWGSTNASSCTGTGFSTGGASSNSSGVSVSPTVTTTYYITCNGAQASATVTVTGGFNSSTWDPSNKSSQWTLSNNNLTATNNTGGSDQLGAGTNANSSGLLYAEFQCTTIGSNPGGDLFGIWEGTGGNYGTYLGDGTDTSFGFQASGGYIWNSATTSGVWSGCVSGDTVGLEVNFSTHTAYARDYHSGSWGSFSSGSDFSGIGGTSWFLAASMKTLNDQTTLCSSPASCGIGPLPSGYSWWQ